MAPARGWINTVRGSAVVAVAPSRVRVVARASYLSGVFVKDCIAFVSSGRRLRGIGNLNDRFNRRSWLDAQGRVGRRGEKKRRRCGRLESARIQMTNAMRLFNHIAEVSSPLRRPKVARRRRSKLAAR